MAPNLERWVKSCCTNHGENCGFYSTNVSKTTLESASELPIVLVGLLGSVLQQPDSGTVAKQQKKKAIEMHNGTQELTLHIKKHLVMRRRKVFFSLTAAL